MPIRISDLARDCAAGQCQRYGGANRSSGCGNISQPDVVPKTRRINDARDIAWLGGSRDSERVVLTRIRNWISREYQAHELLLRALGHYFLERLLA